MEREDLHAEPIDLGVASDLTQGPGGVPIDEALGQFGSGLSDD